MILGCCVVTLASHDSLTLFANSLVFIGFHLLLSGSQVVVILAGIFEFVLASLTSNASRYQSASKTIISMFMNLPRIFLSLFAFSLYNPMLVVVVVVLSSMFNIFVYLFLLRWQSHGVISK